MLIANIECDEIINQCITNITKRVWTIVYNTGEINYNHRQRDKRRLVRVLKRAGLVEDLHYVLEMQLSYGDFDTAIMSCIAKLKHIKEVTECDTMNLWLGPDDGSNFRYQSAKTLPYKGGRPPKCDLLKQLREWLINVKGAQVIWGYEADDALGIYQLPVEVTTVDKECVSLSLSAGHNTIKHVDDNITIVNYTTIAVHCDKDIFMVPGMHLNTMTDEITMVDKLGELNLDNGKVKGTGLYFFYYQLLVGDRTDNIPGLAKGCGPVWAYNILEDSGLEEVMLHSVKLAYQAELDDHEWRDRLLEQADLVWICRNKEEKGRDYIKRRNLELFGEEL